MNGDEFLQTSHLPTTEHRPFSSSKRQMRVLSPVVLPAAWFLPRCIANDLHRGIIARRMISALVLKYRKGESFVSRQG
jgi:hypothetical protein